MSENKHTSEPFDYRAIRGNVRTFEIFGAQGASVAHCVFKDEDARRIVACVNACTGIKTDYLEQIVSEGSGVDGEMRKRIYAKVDAERQRDQLQPEVTALRLERDMRRMAEARNAELLQQRDRIAAAIRDARMTARLMNTEAGAEVVCIEPQLWNAVVKGGA